MDRLLERLAQNSTIKNSFPPQTTWGMKGTSVSQTETGQTWSNNIINTRNNALRKALAQLPKLEELVVTGNTATAHDSKITSGNACAARSICSWMFSKLPIVFNTYVHNLDCDCEIQVKLVCCSLRSYPSSSVMNENTCTSFIATLNTTSSPRERNSLDQRTFGIFFVQAANKLCHRCSSSWDCWLTCVGCRPIPDNWTKITMI